jgi:hypothetical protein
VGGEYMKDKINYSTTDTVQSVLSKIGYFSSVVNIYNKAVPKYSLERKKSRYKIHPFVYFQCRTGQAGFKEQNISFVHILNW